jgi:hypothetical protein
MQCEPGTLYLNSKQNCFIKRRTHQEFAFFSVFLLVGICTNDNFMVDLVYSSKARAKNECR